MSKYKRSVVVYGGRDFTNRRVVCRFLDRLHRKYDFDFLVAGGASGVDTFAVDWARERGIPYKEEPADWSNLDAKPCVIKTNRAGKRYNALAGPARNQSMLDKYKPRYAIEFPGGTGTLDMHQRVAVRLAFGLMDRLITIRRKRNAPHR